MSKIVAVGATAVFACILCATPLSLRLSPQGNVALSTDNASAEIGRPLTATSVAGVNRRVHRRAYRHGYYGPAHMRTGHTIAATIATNWRLLAVQLVRRDNRTVG